MNVEEPFPLIRKKRGVVHQTKQKSLTVSESEDIDGIEVRTSYHVEINKEREDVVVNIKTELLMAEPRR